MTKQKQSSDFVGIDAAIFGAGDLSLPQKLFAPPSLAAANAHAEAAS
jgi:hypothetical protein